MTNVEKRGTTIILIRFRAHLYAHALLSYVSVSAFARSWAAAGRDARAELLGARSLLAGISAEVAELIAAQGITLGNLSSYRDLHDAKAAALDLSTIRRPTPTPRHA